jgi:uncharacterized membrane protein
LPKDVIAQRLRPYVQPGKGDDAVRVVQMMVAESYQGPIPPAREMAAHEEVLSGAADRILSMAEKEQNHEHGIRDRIVGAEIVLRFVGQGLAMLALVLMLLLAAYFVSLGHAAIGATFAGVIVIVVGAFLGYCNITSKVASMSKDAEPSATPPARSSRKPQRSQSGKRR